MNHDEVDTTKPQETAEEKVQKSDREVRRERNRMIIIILCLIGISVCGYFGLKMNLSQLFESFMKTLKVLGYILGVVFGIGILGVIFNHQRQKRQKNVK